MPFSYLYAPERAVYHAGAPMNECVFCSAWNEGDDEKNQILYRDEACFVIMNKYPYAPGHFMVIPASHESALENLDTKLWLRMCELAQIGVKVLRKDFGAPGANIGMNLGAAGGAGIAEHVHLHVLPRYDRDTNFVTTIGHTRVFGANMDEIFFKLKAKFVENL